MGSGEETKRDEDEKERRRVLKIEFQPVSLIFSFVGVTAEFDKAENGRR